MDNIAYLISREFILLGVDTHYRDAIGNDEFVIENVQKISPLNERTMISVIGDQRKAAHVRTYLKKLAQLGNNPNFDSVVSDLKDIFSPEENDIINELRKIVDNVQDDISASNPNDVQKVFHVLKDDPAKLDLLFDFLKQMQERNIRLTQVIVWGWDEKEATACVSHTLYMGNKLYDTQQPIFDPGSVFIKLAESSVPSQITKEETEELLYSIPLTSGWQDSEELTTEVIENGKIALTQGLRKMNRYPTEPNIIFYELSFRTRYVFSKPEIRLIPVEYK